MNDRRAVHAYGALRVAFGVVPIVAGLDKFTNLLTNWEDYLSPLAVSLLPVSPAAFLRAAGIVEIVVGAAILLGFARIFGWVAMAWLALIAAELLTNGRFFDVAARDAVMAVGAYALAQLAQAIERSPAHVRSAPQGPAEASARA